MDAMMWIAKSHFNLIREAAAEFRSYHEECMRMKDGIIRSQEARLAAMEAERADMVGKILELKVPEPVQPWPVAEVEPQDWESIMRAEVAKQQEKAKEN